MDAPGLCVTQGVGDELADDGNHRCAEALGDAEVDGTFEGHLVLHAACRGEALDELEDLAAQGGAPGLFEVEDGGAQPLDGGVQVVERPGEEGGGSRVGGLAQRGLHGESHPEEALDHVVVEVAGDAEPVGGDEGLRQLVAQGEALEHRGEHAGEREEHGGVHLVEGEAVSAVGHVERAVAVPAHADRGAEERVHRGVAGGKADAIGVLGDVGDRDESLPREPKEPAANGQLADPSRFFLVEAGGDEARERGGILAPPDADRPVASSGELSGRSRGAGKQGVQVRRSDQLDHRADERAQSARWKGSQHRD